MKNIIIAATIIAAVSFSGMVNAQNGVNISSDTTAYGAGAPGLAASDKIGSWSFLLFGGTREHSNAFYFELARVMYSMGRTAEGDAAYCQTPYGRKVLDCGDIPQGSNNLEAVH